MLQRIKNYILLSGRFELFIKLYGGSIGAFKRWWLLPRVPFWVSPLNLLQRMTTEDLRFVLLRWEEEVAEGSVMLRDIDLLVDSRDIKKLERKLVRNPIFGRVVVDLFSIEGSSGYGFRGVSYFPPDISKYILRHRIRSRSGISVPDEESFVLSLIYHALIHKGPRSQGSERRELKDFSLADVKSSHNYADVIAPLLNQFGYSKVTWTVADLFQLLNERGWLPPIDTLVRLSNGNAWLSLFCRELESRFPVKRELGLLVVRSFPFVEGVEEWIEREVTSFGFSIYSRIVLDEREILFTAKHLRGGNWGSGRFRDTEQYRPKCLYFIASNQGEGDFFRLLFSLKRLARRKFQENILHSTDNYFETEFFLRLIEDFREVS